MIKIKEKINCSGCKACSNICPKNCIDMSSDDEGFWYPKVDEDLCIECGLCVKVCPEINIYSNDKSYKSPVSLAAWNKSDEKRKKSSSGGIFTSIAEWILSENGIVFGVGYDDNLNVVHKAIDSVYGLTELRGSKYVQSDIGNTYEIAKEYLDKDKKVLFTGTPCQIAGVKNYLQKDYENLYTCDLVCHGVPSPKVFEKYKKNMANLYDSEIERISFRHKKYGWKIYSVLLEFSNNTEYIKTLRNDPYMIGFLKDYYLRPSCYECIHAKLPRVSDITLADYWGVSNKYPEFDDDGGTSLLLVNTNKGGNILSNCEKNIVTHKCDLDHAILGNPSMISSVKKPENRDKFFEEFNNKDFDYIIKKYMSTPSLMRRGIKFTRKQLGLIKRKLENI